MESLKVVVIQKDAGRLFASKNLSTERQIKNSEFQYESWNSRRLKALNVHLVIISPELELNQAEYAVKKIRAKSDVTPIIAIRQDSSITSKATLFIAGLDDYLCVPFDGRELTYRVEALIRRAKPLKADLPVTYKIADVFLDYSGLIITFKTGPAARLTQRQADLLHFFCKHPDVLLERREILHHVWGKDNYFLGRSMDVIITSIRKILISSQVIWLETVHGKGFIFHAKTK